MKQPVMAPIYLLVPVGCLMRRALAGAAIIDGQQDQVIRHPLQASRLLTSLAQRPLYMLADELGWISRARLQRCFDGGPILDGV